MSPRQFVAFVTVLLTGFGWAAGYGADRAFAFSITKPAANPFTLPVDGHGAPMPFDIESTGWRPHQLVYAEICDGKPPTAAGWSPGLDCDLQTSPSAAAASAAGVASFPASDQNFEITSFIGVSPNGVFDCVPKSQIPSDAQMKTVPGQGGSGYSFYLLSAKDAKTRSGFSLGPATDAWTHCQLRVTSNLSFATNDQKFIVLSIPDSGPGLTAKGSGDGAVLAGSVGGAAFLVLAGVGAATFVRRRSPIAAGSRRVTRVDEP